MTQHSSTWGRDASKLLPKMVWITKILKTYRFFNSFSQPAGLPKGGEMLPKPLFDPQDEPKQVQDAVKMAQHAFKLAQCAPKLPQHEPTWPKKHEKQAPT